jgi:hypothetical protein
MYSGLIKGQGEGGMMYYNWGSGGGRGLGGDGDGREVRVTEYTQSGNGNFLAHIPS